MLLPFTAAHAIKLGKGELVEVLKACPFRPRGTRGDFALCQIPIQGKCLIRERRRDHVSLVCVDFVNMSAACSLVSTYSMLIFLS